MDEMLSRSFATEVFNALRCASVVFQKLLLREDADYPGDNGYLRGKESERFAVDF